MQTQQIITFQQSFGANKCNINPTIKKYSPETYLGIKKLITEGKL